MIMSDGWHSTVLRANIRNFEGKPLISCANANEDPNQTQDGNFALLCSCNGTSDYATLLKTQKLN